jgi:hypothetical protein
VNQILFSAANLRSIQYWSEDAFEAGYGAKKSIDRGGRFIASCLKQPKYWEREGRYTLEVVCRGGTWEIPLETPSRLTWRDDVLIDGKDGCRQVTARGERWWMCGNGKDKVGEEWLEKVRNWPC